MHVVWTFKETPAGVLVEIMHDVAFPHCRARADRRADHRRIFHSSRRESDSARMKAHLEARA